MTTKSLMLFCACLMACATDPVPCSLGEPMTGVWEAKFTSLSGPCGQISDEIINLDVPSTAPCDADPSSVSLRDYHHVAACALVTRGAVSADQCSESVTVTTGAATLTGLLMQDGAESITFTFSAQLGNSCYGTYTATITRL